MKKGKCDSSVGLAAAAFQDHLLKTYNLKGPAKSVNNNKSPTQHNLYKNRTAPKFKQKQQQPKEYVLDESKNIQLSLAEKLGIVDTSNPHILCENQWTLIKCASKRRGDLSEPCSICKEYYTHLKQEVILSCSHVFHRKCIGSFERFSGQKTCPVCRCKDYETRVICDGSVITSHKCATKIQTQWRRYVQEKKYHAIREVVPPKDLNLRKQFFENKFLKICDKVSQTYDEHQMDVSQLIHSIDHNIACSRTVMKKLDISFHNETDWESVQHDANRRNFKDCPICLISLKSGRTKKDAIVLSCSHMFHDQCLSAYENFTESSSPLCPICRNVYTKKMCEVS